MISKSRTFSLYFFSSWVPFNYLVFLWDELTLFVLFGYAINWICSSNSLPLFFLSLPLFFVVDINMVCDLSFRMRKQIYGFVSILFHKKWPKGGNIFGTKKIMKCQKRKNFSILNLISQKAHKFVKNHPTSCVQNAFHLPKSKWFLYESSVWFLW